MDDAAGSTTTSLAGRHGSHPSTAGQRTGMSVERIEPAPTEVAARGFFRDLSVASIASGLVAFLFAASGPVVVILATGTKGGLSEADLASWLFGAFFINGLISIAFCFAYRQPLVFFWTIPGTVLVGPALGHLTFAAGHRRLHRHRPADAGAGRDRMGAPRHAGIPDADRDGHGGGRVPAVRARLGARIPERSL